MFALIVRSMQSGDLLSIRAIDGHSIKPHLTSRFREGDRVLIVRAREGDRVWVTRGRR